MSKRVKAAVGGAAVGALLMWLLPFWAAVLVIVAVPVGAYLLLDPSQRRRLRRSSRKSLGR
jgi:membrane protein implicated in regulation of membrane protease activity